MRHVEKDFQKPPVELKVCAQKYKKLFLAGNEDEALKRNYHQKAREALEELYHGKCAYCEISDKAASYMSIDHYRPKSLYKWLAVEWSNLVPSCNKCNESKKAKFPLPEGRTMAIYGEPESQESLANSKKLLDENPLLLHPELDDPRQHLEFKTDGSIKEKNGSERGKTTIEVCALNRDDLKNDRKEQIDEILSSIQRITLLIINIFNDSPEFVHIEKACLNLLSLYYDVFERLRKLQEPRNHHVFTLFGFYMNEEFEYFIIRSLPNEKDTRAVVRKAFMLFKEGKLGANKL